jgi:hypothetical protein
MKEIKKEINETLINAAVGKVDLKNPGTITEAVNMLLGQNGIKSGTSVAVIDDPTYPYSGLRGKTQGEIVNGCVHVKFDNGNAVPLQVNLLIPV